MDTQGHRARKRFGQNFLTDTNLIERMVRAVNPNRKDTLVEIGPGLGAFTVPLLKAAGRLHAVELDRDLIARLPGICSPHGELILHQADALKYDFASLAGDGPIRVLGNLPYNISTPLIFHLLRDIDQIQDMHFTLQKEVVERLAAGPDTGAYGRLSVMVQYRCQAQHLFDLPPEAFTPRPKVTSAFVRLQPLETPVKADNEVMFARVVEKAFQQRRKTLRNTLKGIVSAQGMQALGIDPSRRGETLPVADFIRLADRAWAEHGEA